MPRPFGFARGLCAIALMSLAAGCSADKIDSADAEKAGALESRLAELEAKVQALEDIKAIKRLQRAYGYYLDKGMMREVAALFSDDREASIEIGGRGVYVGKERILAFLSGVMHRVGPGEMANHMILQPVVHLSADGMTAKGRWRGLIQAGEFGKNATWGEGPYENDYVKEGGVWKLKHVHWYMTVAAPYETGWDKAPIPMPGQSRDLPPDRPPSEVYQAFPAPHLPAYHYKNPVSGR